MHYLIIKYLISAGLVVLVSELAKRSDKLGGLIAALPLVTVLALIWLSWKVSLQVKLPITLTTRFGMCYRPCRCF